MTKLKWVFTSAIRNIEAELTKLLEYYATVIESDISWSWESRFETFKALFGFPAKFHGSSWDGTLTINSKKEFQITITKVALSDNNLKLTNILEIST